MEKHIEVLSIVHALQKATGTNEKKEILQSNKNNEALKEYLEWTLCPSVTTGIGKKTLESVHIDSPALNSSISMEDEFESMLGLAITLSERGYTGQSAVDKIRWWMSEVGEESRELFKYLVLKDIRAKVNVSIVNSVWPDLLVDIPYQRCSLLSDKIISKSFEGKQFYSQLKLDGMFAVLVNNGGSLSMYSRNGSKFPDWVSQWLVGDSSEKDYAIEGELVVKQYGRVLDRKKSNGILNSVLSDGELPEWASLHMIAWNMLPYRDWKSGKTDKEYWECLSDLCSFVMKSWTYIELVESYVKSSLEDAVNLNNLRIGIGHEGSVIKTLTHKWKNGTSTECVKMKLAASVDLLWVDSIEGEGKAKGMLGAMCLESSCGKLKVNVGTGFTDKERTDLWHNKRHGSVVEVIANDIITNKKDATLSLFLPRYVGIRGDKDVADSADRCIEIFESAKKGGSV